MLGSSTIGYSGGSFHYIICSRPKNLPQNFTLWAEMISADFSSKRKKPHKMEYLRESAFSWPYNTDALMLDLEIFWRANLKLGSTQQILFQKKIYISWDALAPKSK